MSCCLVADDGSSYLPMVLMILMKKWMRRRRDMLRNHAKEAARGVIDCRRAGSTSDPSL